MGSATPGQAFGLDSSGNLIEAAHKRLLVLRERGRYRCKYPMWQRRATGSAHQMDSSRLRPEWADFKLRHHREAIVRIKIHGQREDAELAPAPSIARPI